MNLKKIIILTTAGLLSLQGIRAQEPSVFATNDEIKLSLLDEKLFNSKLVMPFTSNQKSWEEERALIPLNPKVESGLQYRFQGIYLGQTIGTRFSFESTTSNICKGYTASWGSKHLNILGIDVDASVTRVSNIDNPGNLLWYGINLGRSVGENTYFNAGFYETSDLKKYKSSIVSASISHNVGDWTLFASFTENSDPYYTADYVNIGARTRF